MASKELINEIATRQSIDKVLTYFNRLPDPDPILVKLGKDITVYNDLRSDAHLFSVEQQRKCHVAKLEWQLDRGESDDKVYDILNEVFTNTLNVYDITEQILDSILFGYTVFEIIWEVKDNLILPVRVEEKPREWFFWNDSNQIRLKDPLSLEGTELPPYKFIIARHKPTYRNPYGEKTISRCFWPVAFKRGGIKFWVTFTEKFGMPYLIGKLPKGQDKDQFTKLKDSLEDMIQDAVGVIPDDGSVDVLEFTRTSSVDVYERFLYFMNSEISKAILTETLTTEVQDKSTHAAAGGHSDMLTALTKGDKRIVHTVFRTLIRFIKELNFGNVPVPEFEYYEDEDIDKTLAERDKILTDSGVKFSKQYWLKTYNLQEEDIDETPVPSAVPVSGEGDPAITQQSPVASVVLNGAQIAAAVTIAESVSKGDIPREAGINQLQVFLGLSAEQAEAVMGNAGEGAVIKADKVIAGAKTPQPAPAAAQFAEPETAEQQPDLNLPDKLLQTQIEQSLKPVFDLVDKSESYDTLMEKLSEIYPKMGTSQLETILSKIIFISETRGRIDAGN